MRMLPIEGAGLARIVDETLRADYVYMYPPRQAYRPLEEQDLADRIASSLAGSDDLNLYLHFPFCRQICGFCNLYTIGVPREGQVEAYLDALEAEIIAWGRRLSASRIKTIYFGGGTPSLLSPRQLERMLMAVQRAFGCDLSAISEVAIEVSPETLDRQGYVDLRSIGFNRVNLGVQTLSDPELTKVGRSYGGSVAAGAVEAALASGLSNVCVDLIFGLAGQSEESWLDSLAQVIALAPQTICTYALTARAKTGYAAKGYEGAAPATLYRRYDDARALLREQGYAAENHVRYVRSAAGGYRQKANHWAGENVLGLGAGARSYLRDCDFQNGYSLHQRRRTLAAYGEAVRDGRSPITAGYVMSDDERRRKRVILGLFSLDRASYRAEFGADVLDHFEALLGGLEDHGLVDMDARTVRLTERGARFRDNVVQAFFSAEARRRSAGYAYAQ